MTRSTAPAWILALALGAHGAPGLAQVDHGAHHAAAPAKAASAALDDATVKKIDRTAGKVVLAHGALSNGMPPMTMAYRVQNPAWLTKLKPGQKIRFGVDPAGDAQTIVRLETVQ